MTGPPGDALKEAIPMRSNLDQVQPGWAVVDQLGEKIGDVNDVQADYLVLTKGLIFLKDLYVPRDAIETVDQSDQTVTLNVRKADIDESRWSQAPTSGSSPDMLAGDGS